MSVRIALSIRIFRRLRGLVVEGGVELTEEQSDYKKKAGYGRQLAHVGVEGLFVDHVPLQKRCRDVGQLL